MFEIRQGLQIVVITIEGGQPPVGAAMSLAQFFTIVGSAFAGWLLAQRKSYTGAGD